MGGDLESRRGKFKDVLANSVKITRTAQADTSLTETVATASAGTATIVAGQTQRTIVSPFVTKDSLIYLTPVGDTLGLVPYLARQTAEINPGEDQDLPQGPLRREARSQALPAGRQGSFTIQIPDILFEDIKINWWIIN